MVLIGIVLFLHIVFVVPWLAIIRQRWVSLVLGVGVTVVLVRVVVVSLAVLTAGSSWWLVET